MVFLCLVGIKWPRTLSMMGMAQNTHMMGVVQNAQHDDNYF